MWWFLNVSYKFLDTPPLQGVEDSNLPGIWARLNDSFLTKSVGIHANGPLRLGPKEDIASSWLPVSLRMLVLETELLRCKKAQVLVLQLTAPTKPSAKNQHQP